MKEMRRVWVSGLCAIALITITLACGGGNTEKPLAGQPTMNELMHSRARDQKKDGQRWREIEAQARTMSKADADAVVVELKRRPDDRELFFRILRYYQSHSDVLGRARLTLWYIEHHPNGTIPPGMIHPAWDERAWRQGAALWRQNLKKADANAETWRRAARYFEGVSNDESERILLEAQQKFPKEQWTQPLRELYALTLLGARGPRAEYNTVREVSAEQANSPFAQATLQKLKQSGDPMLMILTAQRIVQSWQPNRPPQGLEHARALVQRALEIAPQDQRVQRASHWMKTWMKASEMYGTPLEKLNETDQMDRLAGMLSYGARPTADGLTEEQKARRLLELAAKHKDHQRYGAALYAANHALARVALKQGDRRSAARLLLASTEGPASEALRFGPIDMTLARELVDWGERSAVAEFLERCSRVNGQGQELKQWAADIRRGINPDLLPYRTN